MGGGRGSRLFPLTQSRCKPAVPLGGKYRLIDIPISNCLNSHLNKIYILTQFHTASLHHHISETYQFDPFSGGSLDILSPEQTSHTENWYQGTADAVRQNLKNVYMGDDDLVLILSGDQLYRMDFREIIAHHRRLGSQLTISSTLVDKNRASELGVMRISDDYRIVEFIEKPKDVELLKTLTLSDKICKEVNVDSSLGLVPASMGIYVFNGSLLKSALSGNSGSDFGKDIIPSLLDKCRMNAFIFNGYWEDIGTVRSFFNANLALANPLPPFNFFNDTAKIYTRARYLPASKIERATINNAIIAEGAILGECYLNHCVISIRSVVRVGSHLQDVLMMGADYFENDKISDIGIGLGIGKNCYISHAIIDKNARIGDNVRLTPFGLKEGFYNENIYVRDNIIIVMKNAVIPSGTSIGS